MSFSLRVNVAKFLFLLPLVSRCVFIETGADEDLLGKWSLRVKKLSRFGFGQIQLSNNLYIAGNFEVCDEYETTTNMYYLFIYLQRQILKIKKQLVDIEINVILRNECFYTFLVFFMGKQND